MSKPAIHTFPIHGDTVNNQMYRGKFVGVTPRDPRVAPPPGTNVWARPVYVPMELTPFDARPGSQDAAKLPSAGLPT